MTCRHVVALMVGLSTLLAAPVEAAYGPGALILSANGGYMWFSNKQHLKNTGLYGAAIGYQFTPAFSTQLQASYFYAAKTARGGGSTTNGSIYTVNGIYHFFTHCKLRPFVLAGLGVSRIAHAPNNDPATLTHFSGGVGGELLMGDDASLSVSGRDNYTFAGGKQDLWVNIGLNFYLFGAKV